MAINTVTDQAANPSNPKLEQRKLHNASIPISNLPAEVLCKIFLSYQDSCCSHNAIWTNVTYVCSFWREVALSCGDLWNNISFASSKWTCITRDRAPGPLTVQAAVNPQTLLSIRDVLGNMKGIRDVALSSTAYDLLALQEILELPAPDLDRLVIHNDPDRRGIVRPLPIPQSAPSRPKLRSLVLRGCPAQWASPTYSSLTRLVIAEVPFSQRPTFELFHSAVTKMSSLEQLVLVNVFDPAARIPSKYFTDCSVSLPHLKHVTVEASTVACASVISFLAPGHAGSIRCFATSCLDFDKETSQLAHVIGSYLQSIESSYKIRRLEAKVREDSHRYTSCYGECNPLYNRSLRLVACVGITPYAPAILDLTFQGPMMATDQAVIKGLDSMCCELPLSELEALQLVNIDAITENTWPSLLKHLQSINRLSIAGHPPSGLMWALFQDAVSQGSDHDLLLPNLQAISLRRVDCCSSGYMLDPLSVFPVHHFGKGDCVPLLHIIEACLRARLRRHARPTDLNLRECTSIPSQAFRYIKEHGTRVVWDGRGLGTVIDPPLAKVRRVAERPTHWRLHDRREELTRL